MQSRLLSVCVAVAVAAGFLSGSPRAAAEFVTLKFGYDIDPGPGTSIKTRTGNPNVDVTLNGTTYNGVNPNPAKVPTGPFYWTENELPANSSFPPPTTTFCIEISTTQPLPTAGTPVDFQVLSLSDGLDTTRAAPVTELYGRFYNNEPGQNWTNPTTFTGSDASAAFQLALWELVFDTGRNLSSGNFTANFSGSIFNTAQSYLNALTGDTSSFNTRFGGQELVVLHAPVPAGSGKIPDQIQDQITLKPVSAVPAPPGLILAGIGFIGLVGRSRFLRKTATA